MNPSPTHLVSIDAEMLPVRVREWGVSGWGELFWHHTVRSTEALVAPFYHVIIADDDAGVRAVIVHIVQQTYPRATTSAVADGLAALHVYDQQGADLVLTNYMMPRLSGLDLIAALRMRNSMVPIIMISGEVAQASAALAAGATHFLAKPFTRVQLVQVLISVLPP
jgi:CheY-like chemotaxis protein